MILNGVVFVLCLLTPVVVSQRPRDCEDVYDATPGGVPSGVYTIYPAGYTAVPVYCDMETDGRRWTVIQRRMDGSVSFYRMMEDYESGFGDANGEYWLGLDNIYALTRTQSELRVDMEGSRGRKFAVYSWFQIRNRDYDYQLTAVDWDRGTAGDVLYGLLGSSFSAPDYDTDKDSDQHCARVYMGGFWYSDSRYYGHSPANPNGVYLCDDEFRDMGIKWGTWTPYSLTSITMKIRRADLHVKENEDENSDN